MKSWSRWSPFGRISQVLQNLLSLQPGTRISSKSVVSDSPTENLDSSIGRRPKGTSAISSRENRNPGRSPGGFDPELLLLRKPGSRTRIVFLRLLLSDID